MISQSLAQSLISIFLDTDKLGYTHTFPSFSETCPPQIHFCISQSAVESRALACSFWADLASFLPVQADAAPSPAAPHT